MAAFRGVFDRIRKEIEQDFLKFEPIGEDEVFRDRSVVVR
jgi:hypothetical protein